MVLAVPFVMLVLATAGLIGYLAFRNGQQAVNDLAGQLHREVTARIQQRLDSYLATPHLINQLNLDSILLGQANVQDANSLERHFRTQLPRFDLAISIAYTDEQAEYVGAERNVAGEVLAVVIQTTIHAHR